MAFDERAVKSQIGQSLEAAAAARQQTPAKRPHGGGWIALGWTLLVAGVLAIMIGLFVGVGDGAGWPLVWFGAGLVNLAMVLLIVGHVIRAIFFLPGRTVTTRELDE